MKLNDQLNAENLQKKDEFWTSYKIIPKSVYLYKIYTNQKEIVKMEDGW